MINKRKVKKKERMKKELFDLIEKINRQKYQLRLPFGGHLRHLNERLLAFLLSILKGMNEKDVREEKRREMKKERNEERKNKKEKRKNKQNIPPFERKEKSFELQEHEKVETYYKEQ